MDLFPAYTIGILLGNGDGTFRDGPKYQLASPAAVFAIVGRLVLADLNRDGKLDIVFPAVPVGSMGYIAVLLGNGDGTFRTPRYSTICEAPATVAAADFNSDGIPDLAVGCGGAETRTLTGSITFQPSVVVLRGVGDGSFSIPSTIQIESATFGLVAAGDLDGDGHADIVVGGGNTRPLTALWGNGLGAFQAYQLPQDQGLSDLPVFADVDGDGRPDIITLGGGGQLSVRLNRGDRTFGAAIVFMRIPQGSIEVGAVGDFNNDGRPDIVMTDQSFTLSVFLNAPSEFDAYLASYAQHLTYGQTVMLNVTLLATSPSFSAPTEVVTWMTGTTVLGASSISVQVPATSWVANFSTILPAGVHNVTNWYSGDSLITNDHPLVIQVDRAASAVVANLASTSPTFDQPISLAVAVSSPVTAPAKPTGTVSLREGDRELASAVIDAVGQAAAVIPAVTGGSHLIQAVYSGDMNYAPSAQSVALTVRPAASSISLACLPNPAGEGEIIRCAVGATDMRATGMIILREGTSIVSSAPLIVGQAELTATDLSKGRHALTATYSGDSNFLPSQSATVTANVVAAVIATLATHPLALASPQALVSLYGQDFIGALIQADPGPLPSQLGGLQVMVLDASGTRWLAPLYFVSTGQIQMVVPDVALGSARLEVVGDDGRIWTGALEIANVAPGLFAANADGEGVAAATILKIASDGAQSYSDAFRCGPAAASCAPAPIDLGDESTETHLILPGTGLRNASMLHINLGGVACEVVNWGGQPQHPGLDQIEVRIPRELMGRGLIEIDGDADDKAVNPLFIQFN